MEPTEVSVEELIERAKQARQELNRISTQLEEATAAHALSSSVHTDAMKTYSQADRLRAAGILLHISFQEVERLKAMQAAGQKVIDELRAYNIGAVDDALDVLRIGGITFV